MGGMTRAAQYPIQTSVLRYFLEIARCQSIRQAAEELNVAASALSRHVSNLERELGVPLFERHARGLRLTAAGEVVAAGARRALRQIERISSDVDDLRDLRRGHVSVYAVEGVVADFLLPLLSEFIRSYPRVTYDIVVGGTQDVIEALVDDQADIGVAFNLQPNSAIDVVYEAEHPVYVVVAKGHPLADRRTLTLKELSLQPLGLPNRSFGIRQLLDRAAAQQGISLKPSVTVNSIEMTKAYVRTCRGLTVLPAFAVLRECGSGEMVAIRIRESTLTHATVALCIHRNRRLSAAGQRLLAEMTARLKGFTADHFGLRRPRTAKAGRRPR
jgi:DNA-binding transcriptional LysR family regulator